MLNTDLSAYDNKSYKPGAGKLKLLLWYICNTTIINSYIFPVSFIKVFILRLFGAKIGKNVNIKPKVNIKYPWRLTIGDNVWIGENVWIDNLDNVIIGNNSCLSQGSMLLCGNHNYKKNSFDLITAAITLETGVWLGTRTIVCPGIICKSHSVLTTGSVATKNMDEYSVYSGNPAVFVRKRGN
jgi:putative colanic acid biosynthesis acetyltransferase WcaF